MPGLPMVVVRTGYAVTPVPRPSSLVPRPSSLVPRPSSLVSRLSFSPNSLLPPLAGYLPEEVEHPYQEGTEE